MSSNAKDRAVKLYLTPEDSFRKPLNSRATSMTNVLMQMTLPKPTGRKRKRGTSDAFAYHAGNGSPSTLAGHKAALKRMHDNKDKVIIEAVGVVNEAHRFRGSNSIVHSRRCH